MRLVGLDVGDRRIGIAFGDSELNLATPLSVIARGTTAADVLAVGKYVRDYGAAKLVVGLPRNMNGSTGSQALSVTSYAQELGAGLGLPVEFWDERLSTVEAARRLREGEESAQGAPGRGRAAATRAHKNKRRNLDAVAAAVILQDYIDAHRTESA